MIPVLPVPLRSVSRIVALMAVLGGSLQSLSGQTDASGDLVVSLRERLDPDTRAAVLGLIDSAAMNGLPIRPLVSKALEGSAKGATATRIIMAVRTLSADLAVARNALGAEASEETLVAGVGALRAGAPAAYLRELREIRGAPSIIWPLSVLADLVGRGVPVDTAAGVILGLARADASDATYAQLEEQVREEVAAGVPPGAAASRAAAGGRIGPIKTPAAGLPRQPARPGTVPRP
jgi:hypothetical protein